METLERYRLNDMSQIERYLEKSRINEYFEYKNKIFVALDNLKIGHCYNIQKQVPKDEQDHSDHRI